MYQLIDVYLFSSEVVNSEKKVIIHPDRRGVYSSNIHPKRWGIIFYFGEEFQVLGKKKNSKGNNNFLKKMEKKKFIY